MSPDLDTRSKKSPQEQQPDPPEYHAAKAAGKNRSTNQQGQAPC